MTETCSKSTWDGHLSYPCTSPAKEDGLCARHLAGARRRKKNDEERDRRWKESDRLREEYTERLAALGLKGSLDVDRQFRPNGYVTVSLADLERWADNRRSQP